VSSRCRSQKWHEVYRQVARFHARPLDEKLKIKLDKHNVGYLPMMGDTLRASVVAHYSKSCQFLSQRGASVSLSLPSSLMDNPQRGVR